MKIKPKLSLNIQFINGEAEQVISFKTRNPIIKHREIYLAGIQALSGEKIKNK